MSKEVRCKRRSEHVKPQESYIAMISSAILSTPEKRMTLSEINEHLMNNYECFRGEYQGWRNSVRHNLSFNKCFVKILRKPTRNWGKNNYWGVVVSLLQDYLREDGKFRRRRRKKVSNPPNSSHTQTDLPYRSVGFAAQENSLNYHVFSRNQPYYPTSCVQKRALDSHERSSNHCMTTFSIDNILGSSKRDEHDWPIECLQSGWMELKHLRMYWTMQLIK